MNKLTSYLDRLTQKKARMESPQAVAYVLKITITGTGVGTVSYSPDTNSFINGQVVSLTAKAQAGSKFVRWTGDITGSHSVCNIRMDSTKLVVAEFISSDFRAEQKIGSTFAAASHSGMLQIETRSPTQVVLSPTQSVNSNSVSVRERKDVPIKHIGYNKRFIDHGDGTVSDIRTGLMWLRGAVGQEWNGITCVGEAITITCESAWNIHSNFAGHDGWRLPTIEELVEVALDNQGSRLDNLVFPNQPGRRFWSSSQMTKDHSSRYHLSPFHIGYELVFSFDSGVIGFAYPDSKGEYVRLVRDGIYFPIKITTEGNGYGTVIRNPESENYHFGSKVTLTAHPVTGSKFKCWHGDANGNNNSCLFVMYSEKTISAEFTLIKYYGLKINLIGKGKGIITQSKKSEKYLEGSVITLTAQASAGSKFKCWHGDAAGHSASCIVTFDAEKTVSAEFLEIETFVLNVTSIGTGSGLITQSLDAEKYIVGTVVTLTARADKGSKFKCWHGDAAGHSATCMVTLDAAKTISAEFVEIETFVLNVISTGSGTGTITRNLDAERYIKGAPVILTACASVGSKFKCWDGDASKISAIHMLKMDSEKNLSAEFTLLEYFELKVNSIGTGKGIITQSPQAENYVEGSVITLTAQASAGSKFKCWHGDATDNSATCMVTLDSAKTVSAEFVQLESFALDVAVTGTGSGHIARSVNAETYFSGSLFTLTAQADEGSIFNGWYGDASGLDEICNVTMNAPLSVGAEFEKLTISDTVITVEMEKVESERLKNQRVEIFYIIIRNKGQEQVRIKVPLTSFVSQSGQASEQDGWFTELVNGSKGVTLTAGAFCRMGLVYFRSGLERGDSLHVNVVPSKPLGSMSFVFKCIDAGSTFILVNASSEDKNQSADATPTLPAMTKLLKRIESLEDSLSEVLRRLDGLQNSIPGTVSNLPPYQASPELSLPEVLKWLAVQDRIAVTELRVRLLPLDLLPGAVINEINERALDLIGELALEEVGNEIVVAKDILDEVLADWE